MLSEKREHVSKLPGVKIPEDMVFTTDVESTLKERTLSYWPCRLLLRGIRRAV